MWEPSRKSDRAPEQADKIKASPPVNGVSIEFPNLDLNKANPVSSSVTITLQKLPVVLEQGNCYCNSSVLIDEDSKKMKELAAQAEALRSLPEQNRPRLLLDIFDRHLRYAHNDAVSAIANTEPIRADWIRCHTGLGSSTDRPVLLPEIFENGFGVCRYLAPAYLWLAQKAGLTGIILDSDSGTITNIQRTDIERKLFQSVEVDEPVGGHSWAEVQLSDGSWIPVDPSTGLVGDSTATMNMFREANYIAVARCGIECSAEPKEMLSVSRSPIYFAPGAPTSDVKICLSLKSTEPTIRFGKPPIPPTNTPYIGPASLSIASNHDIDGLGLTVSETFLFDY